METEQESGNRRSGNAAGCFLFLLVAVMVIFSVHEWGDRLFSSEDKHVAASSKKGAASERTSAQKKEPAALPHADQKDGGQRVSRRCSGGIKKISRDDMRRLIVDEDGDLATSEPRSAKRMLLPDRLRFTKFTEEWRPMIGRPHRASNLKPINDKGLAARLDRIKTLVLSATEPPCAWKWEAVRALVEKHGPRLILEGYGDINPYAGERGADGRPVVFSSSLSTASELADKAENELAAIMVKNATQVVLGDLAMEYSGQSLMEFEFARMACIPFSAVWMHLEVIVVTWNSSRFMETLLADDETSDGVEGIQALDRGDSKPLFKSVSKMVDALVKWMERRNMKRDFLNGWECSFPPIRHGEKEGWEFYPFDIDDPLVNLIERESLRRASEFMERRQQAL